MSSRFPHDAFASIGADEFAREFERQQDDYSALIVVAEKYRASIPAFGRQASPLRPLRRRGTT